MEFEQETVRAYFIANGCTVRPLLSGRLIEVGRLTEVQYKLDRKGSRHDFISLYSYLRGRPSTNYYIWFQ